MSRPALDAIGASSRAVETRPATAPMPGPRSASVDVFGVECFAGSLADATALVVETARRRGGGYGCLCNVHVLETAQRDPALMAALGHAQVVFPDGAPIAWVQRRRLGGAQARVGGPDLMDGVIRDGCAVGLRHALYGSTRAVLDDLEAALRARYPSARIVASIAPAFGPQADADVELELARLRKAGPDVVWVALGAPRQELWAARHAGELAPALVIGVGAAFEFHAGTKARAPLWMQRRGLEWLHRLVSEPRRLGPRYLTTNSRFLVRALADAGRPGSRTRRSRSRAS